MKIGTDQYNTFDTMTMDCWNDRVYYEGKEFPAGHFAAEILNFAGAIHDPLLERIAVLTALVDDLSTAEKSKRHDIASQLKPLLRNTVSWLYKAVRACSVQDRRENRLFAKVTAVGGICGDPRIGENIHQ